MLANFTKNDNSFVCQNCGKTVEKLGYSSRNHCPFCLYSLHVDENPGDRSCDCKGLMKPVGVEYSAKKGYVITHKCLKCKQIKKNVSARDDNQTELFKLFNS